MDEDEVAVPDSGGVGAESPAGLSAQDIADDDDDLTAGLAGMSRLVAGSVPLDVLLTRVAEFAVRAIPGAQGAGVTMHEDGRTATVVASDPFVREVDDIQYSLGQGPCISAAAERRTIRSGNLGGESLWPRFGPRVGRLGVHSALSLPLLLPDEVVGALNVYARGKDAFDPHAEELGELFASAAAVAVHNAKLLSQAQRLVEQLQASITSRAVIDQAIGIVISRSGGTAAEAFASLRAISQREQTKLAVVARNIVDGAARRARARNTTT
jgi:GAF domain-containing protein